mgnify:FL=1
MSRYSSTGSYGHHIRRFAEDLYQLTWWVDQYYQGDRLRYPRRGKRSTDEAGARRFAKRWKLAMPARPGIPPAKD